MKNFLGLTRVCPLIVIGAAAFSFLSFSPYVFPEDEDVHHVVQVIDGNTLRLAGGRLIRLIGVRVPTFDDAVLNEELAAKKDLDPQKLEGLAREAKEFLKYLVEGKQVRLKLEAAYEPFKHQDRSGRIMAYAWFTAPIFREPPDWLVIDPTVADGRFDAFLNACVVRSGLGVLDTTVPFKDAQKFLALEDEAKAKKRGVWRAFAGTLEPAGDAAVEKVPSSPEPAAAFAPQ